MSLLGCKLEGRAPGLSYCLFLPSLLPPAAGTCLVRSPCPLGVLRPDAMKDVDMPFTGRAVLWYMNESVGGMFLFHPQAVSVTSLVVLLLLVWALRDL